jgi:hypothetical protein
MKYTQQQVEQIHSLCDGTMTSYEIAKKLSKEWGQVVYHSSIRNLAKSKGLPLNKGGSGVKKGTVYSPEEVTAMRELCNGTKKALEIANIMTARGFDKWTNRRVTDYCNRNESHTILRTTVTNEESEALRILCRGQYSPAEVAREMNKKGFQKKWTFEQVKNWAYRNGGKFRAFFQNTKKTVNTLAIKQEKRFKIDRELLDIENCFDESLADSDSVTLIELTDHKCRFPFFGDSKGSDNRYCGKPRDRKSYCNHHHAICYSVMQKRAAK